MAAAAAAEDMPVADYNWYTSLDYSIILFEQCFPQIVTDDDLEPLHYYYRGYAVQPLKKEFYQNSGVSVVRDDPYMFKVTLDARYFESTELFARILNDDELEVSGNRRARGDGFGLGTCSFVRRYYLPHEGSKSVRYRSCLGEDGMLRVHIEKPAVQEFDIEIDNVQGL